MNNRTDDNFPWWLMIIILIAWLVGELYLPNSDYNMYQRQLRIEEGLEQLKKR